MHWDEKYQKWIVLVAVLLASVYFLYLVRGILFPFFVAGLIAYLVNPLIQKLLRRGFSRVGAIVLLFSMLLTIALIFGVFGLPLVIEELDHLTASLPSYVNDIQEKFDQFYADFQRIKLPAFVKQIADQTLVKAEQAVIDFLNRVTDIIFDLISHLTSLLMAPVIAYYLLKDMEIITKGIEGMVPKRHRKEIFQIWVEINAVLSGFMRGQFLVSLFIAAVSTIGLIVLKVNFAVVLGTIAGVFNIIPYLGPILGAIPAVGIALLKSPLKALGVAILFQVVQQIESGFISPKIVGSKVGLHPITVIFAVLAGGQLGGILGMILAVPIAGVVKVILKFTAEKMAE